MSLEHGKPGTDVLADLKEWRADLDPDGLREEVIDLTSRDFWSLYRTLIRGTQREPGEVYADFSQALLDDLSVLEELEDWLGSAACRSGGQAPLGRGIFGEDRSAEPT